MDKLCQAISLLTCQRYHIACEPVGMAKDFDFQMPVIYVMFKLTIWVASTTRTVNLNKYTQLRS